MLYMALIGAVIFLFIFFKIAEHAGIVGAIVITILCILFVIYFLAPALEGTFIERGVDNMVHDTFDILIRVGVLDPCAPKGYCQ